MEHRETIRQQPQKDNSREGAARPAFWLAVSACMGIFLYYWTELPELHIIAASAVLCTLATTLDTLIVTGTLQKWVDHRTRVRELQAEVDKAQNERINNLEARLTLLESGTLTVVENGVDRQISRWDDIDKQILDYCRNHLFAGGSLQVHRNGQIKGKYKNALGSTAQERLESLGWVKMNGSSYLWNGPDTIVGVSESLG